MLLRQHPDRKKYPIALISFHSRAAKIVRHIIWSVVSALASHGLIIFALNLEKLSTYRCFPKKELTSKITGAAGRILENVIRGNDDNALVIICRQYHLHKSGSCSGREILPRMNADTSVSLWNPSNKNGYQLATSGFCLEATVAARSVASRPILYSRYVVSRPQVKNGAGCSSRFANASFWSQRTACYFGNRTLVELMVVNNYSRDLKKDPS